MKTRAAVAAVLAFIAGGAIVALVLVGLLGYRLPASAPKPVAVASPSPSPSPTPSGPSTRFGASMAFDEERGNVVLFGGQTNPIGVPGPPTNLAETWTWDGAKWQQRHPATEPPARVGAGMTYYPDHKLVVMWGGLEGSIQGADFWSWDGANWTLLRSPNAPPAEDQSGWATPAPILTYDGSRHLVVLVRNNGNHPAFPKAPDVWTWDGSTWSHPNVAGAPAIWGTGAYDPALSGLVFFGVDASQKPQTSLVKGNAWSQLTSVVAPQFELDNPPPMVYVKTADTVALVDPVGGVWLWANGDWTQQSGSRSLQAARDYSVVFDSARGVVVRFGGGQTSTWNGQTWRPAA